MTDQTEMEPATPATGWRFRLGVVIFVVGFASPLLIPLVTTSNLPVQWKSLISGALAVGIPELFSIVAVAVMGKSGFDTAKRLLFGFLKKHGPPERVGRRRYRTGLVMFSLPLLLAWLGPYLLPHLPGYEAFRLPLAVVGDVLFISSLFVLGGEFWDKVQSLFVHDSRVVLEGPSHG